MSRTLSAACVAVTAGLLIGSPSIGHSQSSMTSSTEQVSAGMPSGTRAYSAGAWGLVEVQVVSRSDQPAKVLSSLYFENDPNLQFGREAWLPPRSRRLLWHPVLVPDGLPPNTSVVRLNSLFLDRTHQEERFVPTPTGQMLSDALLPIDEEGRLTCRIGSADPEPETPTSIAITDMLIAVRHRAGLSRKVVSIRGHVLPQSAEVLQGMDHLVLTGDRPLSDAAGLDAIRSWVHRGGRVWILLDRVSPTMVERLLGGASGIQTVDRVGLTDVQIVGQGDAARSSDRERREFEVPVEMVRVIVDNAEVLHTVNGWPASFVQRVGLGEVYFTTVEAKAWLRPRRSIDVPPPDRLGETALVAGDPLAFLAEHLMRRDESVTVTGEDWRPFLTEQIGYRIVGRETVLTVLGLFWVVLAGIAYRLDLRGRMEQLGWLAPVASVVTAGVLALIGLQNSGSVPAMVAEGQLIETVRGSSDAHVSGLLAFYSPTTSPAPIGAEDGGIFLPDMAGFTGQARRMVWSDWDAWHWENLTLPSGVRLGPFQKDVQLASPILAAARFGPNGLTGHIKGPLDNLEDAVLAAPTGENLAVGLTSDRQFTAGRDDVLPVGTFTTSSLMDDSQRRRQRFFQRLLRSENGVMRYQDQIRLLAWTQPIDVGFQYPPGITRSGAALVAMPVELERTPPNTDVVIPSPFMAFEPAFNPNGNPPSLLYHKRTREWVEHSGDIEAWLRFTPPKSVAPLDLNRLELTTTVRGAIERLELVGRRDESTVTLREWEKPSGTLRATLEDVDLPAVDAAGGFLLGLRVHGTTVPLDADSTELRRYWKVESLRLDVRGRTADVSVEP